MYPSRTDAADYLQTYARHFDLPIRMSSHVNALSKVNGEFVLGFSNGEQIRARQVVVATGAFGRPFVPRFAENFSEGVLQLHSSEYRNPAQAFGKKVLVVGGGNSGFQIALELAAAGGEILLSEGTRNRVLPQRLFGRDVFHWLNAFGAMSIRPESLAGRVLRKHEPIIGTSRGSLRAAGVRFAPRLLDATSFEARFANGLVFEPDTIVWATGFRHDDSWIQIPQAVDQGKALIVNGTGSCVEGLHALGRPWANGRGSALLGYVGRDAEGLSRTLTRNTKRFET